MSRPAGVRLTKISTGHYYVERDGERIGRVWSERSSKARHVAGVGGVTHWVAAPLHQPPVTQFNTYTREHAIEQLLEALS